MIRAKHFGLLIVLLLAWSFAQAGDLSKLRTELQDAVYSGMTPAQVKTHVETTMVLVPVDIDKHSAVFYLVSVNKWGGVKRSTLDSAINTVSALEMSSDTPLLTSDASVRAVYDANVSQLVADGLISSAHETALKGMAWGNRNVLERIGFGRSTVTLGEINQARVQ